MSDLISKQDVINALDALCDRECEYSKKQRSAMCVACHLGFAFDVVEQLPSAQPTMCKYWDNESSFCALNRPSAQPESEEFEWCHDCKEYDQKQHCCHRWTKVIRNTVEEIKAYQQWIPVSERLPDKEAVYLVTTSKNNVYLWTYKPEMAKVWIHFISAWSYLPEPYYEV